jgi:hypothetical protein
MSVVYLKIKIKSLAEEARIIRAEERRHNIGTRARKRIRRHLAKTNNLTEAQRRALQRRSRPPTGHQEAIFWGLRSHRVRDVRREARAALLAYAFLRGRSYLESEGNAGTEPDWGRVVALVKKYGPVVDSAKIQDALKEWAAAATGAQIKAAA